MAFCTGCGARREAGTRFCIQCGQALGSAAPSGLTLAVPVSGGLTPAVLGLGLGGCLMTITAFLPWLGTLLSSKSGIDFLGLPLIAGILALGVAIYTAVAQHSRALMTTAGVASALAFGLTAIVIVGILAVRMERLGQGGFYALDAPYLAGAIFAYAVGAGLATVSAFTLTTPAATMAIFGRRAAATVIDSIILLPVQLLVSLAGSDVLTIVLGILASAVYAVIFWVRWGATPGKRITGIRIVAADAPERTGLEPATAVLRWIGYWVSTLPVGLGYLWMLWDERHQCWHDKMAGTLVVRVPSAAWKPA